MVELSCDPSDNARRPVALDRLDVLHRGEVVEDHGLLLALYPTPAPMADLDQDQWGWSGRGVRSILLVAGTFRRRSISLAGSHAAPQ